MEKLRWKIDYSKVFFTTYFLVIINFLIAGLFICDLIVREKISGIYEIPSVEMVLIVTYIFIGILYIYVTALKHRELNEIKSRWPGQNENEIAIPIADVSKVNLNKKGSQVRTSKGYYTIPPGAHLINVEVLKKNSENLPYELSFEEINVEITPQMFIGYFVIVGIFVLMIIYLLPG